MKTLSGRQEPEAQSSSLDTESTSARWYNLTPEKKRFKRMYHRCPEKTATGLRHDHILFRGSYIEQAYLSHLWREIHHSPVVDIRRVRGRHRLACYLANYLAKSPSARYSYSWSWVWKGFAKSWKFLKTMSAWTGQDFKILLTVWQRYVRLDVKPDSQLGVYWLNKLWGVTYGQANEGMARM